MLHICTASCLFVMFSIIMFIVFEHHTQVAVHLTNSTTRNGNSNIYFPNKKYKFAKKSQVKYSKAGCQKNVRSSMLATHFINKTKYMYLILKRGCAVQCKGSCNKHDRDRKHNRHTPCSKKNKAPKLWQ